MFTKIKNERNGIEFMVRVVLKGDKYGKDMCLVNEGSPLVEFYDTHYPFDSVDGIALGQFVTRYNIGSFLHNTVNSDGVCLDGNVHEWWIDQPALKKVRDFLTQI